MGLPYPPLITGSAIIGLSCHTCQLTFVRGDVLRHLVINGVDRGRGIELDVVFVHDRCDDPQAELA